MACQPKVLSFLWHGRNVLYSPILRCITCLLSSFKELFNTNLVPPGSALLTVRLVRNRASCKKTNGIRNLVFGEELTKKRKSETRFYRFSS